jgi:hypothetical protein
MQAFLTYSKILQNAADGFTSPPKEVMLWIFIALSPLSLAEFESANFRSSDNGYILHQFMA